MAPRTLVACSLVVCSLVFLAGCGAVFGGERTPTETLTPAPLPTTTETPERWTLAPGLSGGGVADVDALVAAHRAALRDRSYVWLERRGRVVGESMVDDAPVPLSNLTVARVESPRVYRVRTRRDRVRIGDRARDVSRYEAYADVRDLHVRYLSGGDAGYRYETVRAVDAGDNEYVGAAATDAIRTFLAVDNATVYVTRVDGRRRYRIVGHEPPVAGAPGVANYTVTATVSAGGFVRSLDVSFVYNPGGVPRRVRYAFAYEAVGETTVDSPPWYREERGGFEGEDRAAPPERRSRVGPGDDPLDGLVIGK